MEQKNVIVTGGSRGIGYAIAEMFVESGARVLILSRNQAELTDAREKLAQKGSADARVCDVSQESSVAALSSYIREEFGGRVDVLVNAAGIYGPMGLLEDTDVEMWKQTFEVNVYGTMLMTRLVIPLMRAEKRGRVITFSGGGEGAFPNFSAYASTKGAIIRFTESVAAEVKDDGITMNAIAPGAVNTSLTDEVLAAGAEKVGADFYERSVEQKKSGGVSPRKAAELVMFLASDEARHLSGKMFSAVYDSHEVLASHAKEIASSDVYNVRRIKPKDRGLAW